MKRNTIDSSRELRFWLTQVMIPSAGLILTALNIPEVKQYAISKISNAKNNISKLKRG